MVDTRDTGNNNPPHPQPWQKCSCKSSATIKIKLSSSVSLCKTRLLVGEIDGAEHRDDYSDFLRTQPPIFMRAKDPLDADHWLRTIEQKLALIQCEKHEKVLYAAHQLQDATGAWWQGHVDLQPAGHRFT